MIKVWFVVGWAFAVASGSPAGTMYLPQMYKEGTKHDAIQNPISTFQDWGPAFKSERECREWVLDHVEIEGRISAGCASISVQEVRSAEK